MTKETGEQWPVDHIIPFDKGGGHTIFNVQVMLLMENISKGSR